MPPSRDSSAPSPGDRWDDPRLFPDQAEFRAWLAKNHDQVDELWVGFYKKAVKKTAMTYLEAVEESLCWGWIDGIKKRVDDERYTNRFTPRKARSKWSKVNLESYATLLGEGRIQPPGAAAFARFDPDAHAPYSFERERDAELSPELAKAFRAAEAAWAFFQDQPPGYRRTALHWVMNAKREATRARRLGELIEVSADGRRLPQISRQPRKG